MNAYSVTYPLSLLRTLNSSLWKIKKKKNLLELNKRMLVASPLKPVCVFPSLTCRNTNWTFLGDQLCSGGQADLKTWDRRHPQCLASNALCQVYLSLGDIIHPKSTAGARDIPENPKVDFYLGTVAVGQESENVWSMTERHALDSRVTGNGHSQPELLTKQNETQNQHWAGEDSVR